MEREEVKNTTYSTATSEAERMLLSEKDCQIVHCRSIFHVDEIISAFPSRSYMFVKVEDQRKLLLCCNYLRLNLLFSISFEKGVYILDSGIRKCYGPSMKEFLQRIGFCQYLVKFPDYFHAKLDRKAALKVLTENNPGTYLLFMEKGKFFLGRRSELQVAFHALSIDSQGAVTIEGVKGVFKDIDKLSLPADLFVTSIPDPSIKSKGLGSLCLQVL